MPRHSNTDARRAQIVQALLPVLARKGYGRATVLEIAREAGLAPGLIHYHFASKQEILVCLVHSMVEAAQARFEEMAPPHEDPLRRLRAHLESRLGLGPGADADMVAAWVMVGAEAVREPEVRQVYRQAVADDLARLEALVADCLKSQGRRAAAARPLASGLMALMTGSFQLASATPGLLPTGYAATAAWDFARLAIEATPPAAPAKKSSRAAGGRSP